MSKSTRSFAASGRTSAARTKRPPAKKKTAPQGEGAARRRARASSAGTAPARRTANGRRYSKKKSGGKLLFSLAVLVLVGAAVISCAMFFQVKNISAGGSTRYAPEALIAASGVQRDDKLLLLNKRRINTAISQQFPYVKEVILHRRLPDSLHIEIVEESAALFFAEADGYALASLSGKLLERVAQHPNVGILVLGYPVGDTVLGKTIAGPSPALTQTFSDFMNAVERHALQDKIGAVDLGEEFAIRFTFENRLTVQLGTTDRIEQKFKMLKEIASTKLYETERGILELSGAQARFVADPSGGVL